MSKPHPHPHSRDDVEDVSSNLGLHLNAACYTLGQAQLRFTCLSHSRSAQSFGASISYRLFCPSQSAH
jgi:hypothetical protein